MDARSRMAAALAEARPLSLIRDPGLRSQVSRLAALGLAESTREGGYARGVVLFLEFCDLFGVDPLDAAGDRGEEIMVSFLAWLGTTYESKAKGKIRLAPGSLHVYLHAVQHAFVAGGMGDILAGRPIIKLVQRGLDKELGASGRHRLPITPKIFRALMCVLRRDGSARGRALTACVGLMWCFLLRASEAVKARKTPERQLKVKDVVIKCTATGRCIDVESLRAHPFGMDGWHVELTVTESKNHKESKTVALDGAAGVFNPLRWAIEARLLAEARGARGRDPLFKMGYEELRQRLRAAIRDVRVAGECLDVRRYGTHSLRAGGATALFSAGASAEHIMRLGRWASDAFRAYASTTVGPFMGLAKLMANAACDLL